MLIAQLDKAFVRARPTKIWPRLVAYGLFEGRPLTTRGRWINPLVFTGYKIWSLLPLKTRDTSPVFILGVGRSGTTILGKILALHRDVGYLNEPKALWHAALGNDDLIGSYSSSVGRYRLTGADAVPLRKQRLERFYSAFLLLSKCRRVVDKYPELLFRTKFLTETFPKSKKIILIRNGLDICQSIQKWSQRHGQMVGHHTDDWWGRNRQKWNVLVNELAAHDPVLRSALPEIKTFTSHVDMAAVEWILAMREALKLRARSPDEYLFVPYEELISNPSCCLSNILDFCDLNHDSVVIDYAKTVLSPQARHGTTQPHSAIAHAFNQTMADLGYAHVEQA